MQVKGPQWSGCTYYYYYFTFIQTPQVIPHPCVVVNIAVSFTVFVPGAEVQSSVELVAQAGQVDLFWSGLRAVLDSGQQNSKLHDVAQLSYSVPALRTPTPTQDPKAEVSWQTFVSWIYSLEAGYVSPILHCLLSVYKD